MGLRFENHSFLDEQGVAIRLLLVENLGGCIGLGSKMRASMSRLENFQSTNGKLKGSTMGNFHSTREHRFCFYKMR